MESRGATLDTRAVNVEALYPLTSLQEGILFHTLASADPGVYVQQYTADIDRSVEPDLFLKAWESTVTRHDALRSLVIWEERESPLQLVRSSVALEWHRQDLSSIALLEQSTVLARFVAEDRQRAFDLDKAPLMRFALFDLGNRFHFVWTHHHLMLDGWSLGIVLDDVRQTYERLENGQTPNREPGPSFQRVVSSLEKRDRSDAVDFWKRYLDGFDGPNQLVAQGLSQSSSAITQEEARFVVSQEATAKVGAFVRSHGLTMNSVLRAAWAQLVGFYSDEDDVVFGTVVNGRGPEIPDSLTTVGLLMNTIPVRARLDPDQAAIDFIHSLQDEQVAATNHEWMPLSEIQALVGANAVRPLFDTVMVVENLGQGANTDIFDSRNEQYLQRSNFPLALLVFPGESLAMTLLYDPTLFTGDTADRLLHQFVAIIHSIATHPQRKLAEIDVLPDSEQTEILVDWNSHDAEPPTMTVLDSIRSLAESRPHSPAVRGGDVNLSYSELIESSEKLARVLVARGVAPGDLVLVLADRSPASLVAMLGIQFAGGAYVPLDPATPARRLRLIAEETEATLIVATDTWQGPKPISLEPVRLANDGRLTTPEATSTQPLPSVDFDAVAYVMYTSGSTGRPKGVVVTHSNLAYSTAARGYVYEKTPETYLVVSPFYFDSSVAGIYWTLTTGGQLVLPEPDLERDIFGLIRLVTESRITHLLTLPSVYRLMAESASPEALATLQVCIVAGEACEPAVAEAHFDRVPDAQLWNEYGPTETTVWAVAHEVTGSEGHRVPIGTAIPFAEVYLLDTRQRPVPYGATGELFIGGPLVTNGYLSDPTLTDARFVTVDLPKIGPTRLYGTGDLVRYIGPGVLDILGRSDDQVKIRGRRIEPGEVETALQMHPMVQSAAVITRQPRPGEHELAGFYVASDPAATPDELGRHLQDVLPSYLVPTELVLVDALPLNANGKIDRKQLFVDPARHLPGVVEQPTSRGGKTVLRLARELIGDGNIALSDNFFDVGGHSLLAMQLIARVFKDTSVELSPNVLLFNTLGHVASKVDLGLGTETMPTSTTTSRRSTQSDEPVRFGDRDGSLFGIIHHPDLAGPDGGFVVLCPPYGWEYYKSHWALRQTANQLTSRGHTVLRFDYFGTGDSLGDPGDASVDRWIDDIVAAGNLAREIGESSTVTLVGLRLGATMAARASAEAPVAESLLLWDPIVSGAKHMDELQAMHVEAFSTDPRRVKTKTHGELLGSPYPERIATEIRRLDLYQHLDGSRARVILSSASEQVADLQRHGVVVDVVEDASGWNDIATFNSALLPRHIPRHLAELVESHT